jgi:HPt (histidine-containing phosphotransfer) domain-containing protein
MTEKKGDMHQSRTIVIQVDPDIRDLIPGFLESRADDVKSIHKALQDGDYETVRVLGHRMKGNGAGYGFDAITTIGMFLEQAAKEENPEDVRRWVDELISYLQQIEVVYE